MKDKTASVFILALWTLFLLGALALAVGSYVSADLKLAGRLKTRTTAYYLARAGVEKAIMEIMRNADMGNASSKSWSDVPLGDGAFSVKYSRVAGTIVTNCGYMIKSINFPPSCFCGVAVGKINGQTTDDLTSYSATPTEDSQIDFVFDKNRKKLLYWYEY